MKLLRKFRALFRKEKLDAEMAEEMRAHLELQAAENERRCGMSASDARHAAQRSFGGVEQVKERCRDERTRGVGWLEQTWRDVRYAARSLRKSPGFTLTAVFTLALGIGLVTIQFSFINGALLKGLPFEGSERIMAVTQLDERSRTRSPTVAQFATWREQQKSFAAFAAHGREMCELSGSGIDARSFRGAAFSAGVLEALRVRPVLGRGFLPSDEDTAATPVVILGHHVWETHFGADPKIVGRSIRLRGEPATIIGVLPPKFAFPENEEVWINLRPGAAAASARPGARASVEIVARLHDDVTLATARAEFDVLVRQSALANTAEASPVRSARIWPFTKRPDNSKIVIALVSLLGVVGGVLAIACLNVANLLSARALQRSHEVALRSALGASRSRLVRQMLVESCLLAATGAAAGVIFAFWGVPLLNRGLSIDPAKPFWIHVDLDYRVLAATAGLSLIVGVLAGLFPALRATRGNANTVLKESAGGATSVRLGRLNHALVVVQVAVSCAVLLATSALVNAVIRQSRIDLPFDPAATLVADVVLPDREFADQATRMNFQLRLLERLRALPGVKTATLSRGYPLQRSGQAPVEIMGGTPPPDGGALHVYHYNHVAPDFFRDTRIALTAGRDFTTGDHLGSEPVAIVNERFARAFWPGESALGKKTRRQAAKGAAEEPWRTVIGVTADLPVDPVTQNGGMVIHVPLLQRASSQVTMLLIATGDPRALARPVREIVRGLSVDLPVENCHTLADHFEQRVAPGRVFGGLAFAFGASGLLLAAVGVYGVTSFAVQRRTREFGVRMALGAKPSDLLALVFRQGVRQLALGLIAGAVAGWFFGRPLARMASRIAGPPGLEAYAVVFVVVALALAFALWWPARRAAKIDPMVALRTE